MKNRPLVILTALAVVLGIAFLVATTGGGTARGQVQVGSGSYGCEPVLTLPTPTDTPTPTPTITPRRRRPRPRRRQTRQRPRRLRPRRRQARQRRRRLRLRRRQTRHTPTPTKTATPTNTLTPTPTKTATPTATPECLVPKPLDIVLVIDRSGSMGKRAAAPGSSTELSGPSWRLTTSWILSLVLVAAYRRIG